MLYCWYFVGICTCDLLVYVVGLIRIYDLVECCWILVPIRICDLVVCTSTNSYVRIGLKWCRCCNTNSYIWSSIIQNSMESKEEETSQLKRYDGNCTAAICSRWIGWKMKNYESGVKRQQSTNRGIRSVWLVSSATTSGSLTIIQSDALSHVTDWATEHTMSETKKWPVMNLATYTN